MSEFKINPNDSAYAKPDTRGIAANFGLTKREKLIMDLYVSGITKSEIKAPTKEADEEEIRNIAGCAISLADILFEEMNK